MRRAHIYLTALLLLPLAACSDKSDGETDTTGDDCTDSAGCDTAGDTGDVGPSVVWETAFDASGLGAMSGVWGSGPDDIFVDRADIMHYDGTSWTQMDAPDVGLLVWVFGFGPDDVYSVGVGGGFVHYDGTSWAAMDSGTTEDLWGIWGSANDDIWIVGGDIGSGDPIIMHYDGAALTQTPLDESQNSRSAESIFKVWGIGDLVFAVGQRGLIVQWDGARWVETPAGSEANDDFVSLWGTSEDHIVAVGGRSNGLVSVWDGSSWTTTAPSGLGGLNAVNMQDPDEAIIGGIYGYTGTFYPDDGTLVRDDVLTNLDVHAIWGDGAGRFYGVGGRFYDPYEGVALVRTVVE
jgi:hypothetical protein